MSSQQQNDWTETQEQFKTQNPIRAGKTWLRHKENTQAAIIDLMILEGKSSVENIAQELNRRFKPEKAISARLKRVKEHIDHLQHGSDRDEISGRTGHQLKLEEVDGKWRFMTD